MSHSYSEKKLKKNINFFGLLSMCVGLNIGGTLFALTGVAASFSGPSLPIALLISSIPVLLALVPYMMLTSAAPTTSASYRYTQMLSPSLALISILTLTVCMLIGGQPLFALAFGLYFQGLAGVDPVWAGIGVFTVFYIINLIGVKPAAAIQSILFFILMSALGLFILKGIPHVQQSHFVDLFPNGLKGTMSAAGLMFTFSAGGFFVVDIGGEVVQARKALPRALFAGMLIAITMYILIHTVTIGTIDWTQLKGKSLILVAKGFMSRPLMAYFVVGGALVACATTINTVFAIVSRGMMVMANEGFLPGFMGTVNERFGTPHWALTTHYLVSVVSLIIVPSLTFYGAILNLGMIFSITSVTMTGLVLHQRYPDLIKASIFQCPPLLLKVICWIAIGLNTLIFLFLSFGLGKRTFIFFGIVGAVSFYTWMKRGTIGQVKAETAQKSEFPLV